MVGVTGQIANPSAEKQLDAHRRRAAAAWSLRDRWQQILLDVYDFAAPTRLSTRYATRAPGARVNRMFDSTAMVSLFRFAKRVQKDYFSGDWFALKPGAATDNQPQDVKDKLAREAERVTKIVGHVFNVPEWSVALKEGLIDTGISTGFVMLLKGDGRRPVRFVSASLDECAIDLGPWRDIAGVYFKRKWTYRSIFEQWPDGKYDSGFKTHLDNDAEVEVELCQDVTHDYARKRWHLRVYLKESEKDYIHEEDSRTCPWLTPRLFTLPGQAYGFGIVMLALPTIKTLNKAMELMLRAAALAMAGIFTRVDDGVFNPDTARVEPGAFWAVARNGGVLGPSIQKLDPPGDIQLSNLVLNELRTQVQTVMEDSQLPPDANSPRSAIEIAERIKRVAADQTGDEVLLAEIGVPAVNRVLEILHDLRVLPEALEIDGMFLKMELASAAALAQKASPVSAIATWLQMIQAIDPQMLHLMTPLDQMLAEIGADIGVPAHLINPAAQRQALAAAAAKAITPQVQAQINPPAPPPPANGAPAQPGLRAAA
ncbi:MAG: portal protein [Roseiarcus sp.]